jgi:hypothetical protein
MEETKGITVKVRESLHGKARQEAETKEQTMSQFIEAVLEYYFNRSEEKGMGNTNKRTLAFQVSDEFFDEVQAFIKARGMKLKDFGLAAMRRMMDEAAPEAPETQE